MICPICHKDFYKSPSKKATYCSWECRKQHKTTEATRKKLSKALKGRMPKNFSTIQKLAWASVRGTKQTDEQKRKSGLAVKNSPKFQAAMKSERFRKKQSELFKRIPRATGERHWNWQGGKWSDEAYRKSYIQYNNRKQKLRRQAVKGSHTRKEWEALKEHYGHACLSCRKTEPSITLTVDHTIPVARGGSNNISNIQPLCLRCNMRKKTQIINFKEHNVSLIS